MKNNIRNLFGKDEEQTIRTLAKYYPLNEATNTFEIALRYEKASDLFEENTDTLERSSRVAEGITDQMAEMLDDIPKGYSADVSIRVDDYEGYSAEQLMDGFKDALFLRHRRFLHEATRDGMKMGAMLASGIVMILVLTIGRQIGWWGGDDTVSEILTYLLDTLGCVLIWEGLYMAFLNESEEYDFEQKISHKISSISFWQDNKDRAAAVILYTNVYGFIMLFGEGSKLIPIEMILVICIIIAGLTFLIGHGMNYALYRQNKRR